MLLGEGEKVGRTCLIYLPSAPLEDDTDGKNQVAIGESDLFLSRVVGPVRRVPVQCSGQAIRGTLSSLQRPQQQEQHSNSSYSQRSGKRDPNTGRVSGGRWHCFSRSWSFLLQAYSWQRVVCEDGGSASCTQASASDAQHSCELFGACELVHFDRFMAALGGGQRWMSWASYRRSLLLIASKLAATLDCCTCAGCMEECRSRMTCHGGIVVVDLVGPSHRSVNVCVVLRGPILP